MSKLSFDLPIWGAVVWHSERGATNPWTRAFNVVETGDEQADNREALKITRELFEADGLSAITIYQIELGKLGTMWGEAEGA